LKNIIKKRRRSPHLHKYQKIPSSRNHIDDCFKLIQSFLPPLIRTKEKAGKIKISFFSLMINNCLYSEKEKFSKMELIFYFFILYIMGC